MIGKLIAMKPRWRRPWPLPLLALFLMVAAPATGRPDRVVSINVCTDQLLLLVAARRQIAAVTNLAGSAFFSNWPEKAAGLPVTRGLAEQVLRLKPDLVLAGVFSPKPTVNLLRKLGLTVEVLPVANSLADVRRNLALVGRLVGQPDRARQVIAAFDRRLARTRPPPGARRPVAAFYWLGGYSSGSATLAGDVARVAGFDNLADRYGLPAVGPLPLEHLVAGRPDALIVAVTRGDAPSLSLQALRHPALRRLLDSRPHTAIASRLWVCGTPAVAEAAEKLADLRRRALARSPGQ